MHVTTQELRDRIAARTKTDGTAIKGFTRNVAALKTELARREVATARVMRSKESGALDTPTAL